MALVFRLTRSASRKTELPAAWTRSRGGARGGPHRGKPKPARRRSSRPRFESTRATKARAAAALFVERTTAISYRIGGCAQAGRPIVFVRLATARESVEYTNPASAP